jgi:flagellar basal-body rod protein FlgB
MEDAMQIATPMGEALGRYLNLSTQQMKLTAENMANIDTPGYKTQGFDFEQAFGSAMNQPIHGGKTAMDETQTGDVDGLVARPDGNTVSMDREGLEMAKAQLQFRTGVALLKGEFSRVMSAIHADAK